MPNIDPISVKLSASWELDRPSTDTVSRLCKLHITELLWLSNPSVHLSDSQTVFSPSLASSQSPTEPATENSPRRPTGLPRGRYSVTSPPQPRALPLNSSTLSPVIQSHSVNVSPAHSSAMSIPASPNVFLTVRMRHTPRRLLRSPEIHLISTFTPSESSQKQSVRVNVHCNILYSHFLKKDSNVLQIVVQRRKNIKNKAMALGYKTLAYCNVDLTLVLQHRVERRFFDLYSTADYDEKPSTILGRMLVLSLNTLPLMIEPTKSYNCKLDTPLHVTGSPAVPVANRSMPDKFAHASSSTSRTKLQHFSSTTEQECYRDSYHKCTGTNDLCYLDHEPLETSAGSSSGGHEKAVFLKNKTMKMMRDGVRRQIKEKLNSLMKKMKIQESQDEESDENTAALWAELEKLETVSDFAEGSLDDEDEDGNNHNSDEYDSDSFAPGSTPKPALRPFYTNNLMLDLPSRYASEERYPGSPSAKLDFSSEDSDDSSTGEKFSPTLSTGLSPPPSDRPVSSPNHLFFETRASATPSPVETRTLSKMSSLPSNSHQQYNAPPATATSKLGQATRDRAAVFRDKLRHMGSSSPTPESHKKSVPDNPEPVNRSSKRISAELPQTPTTPTNKSTLTRRRSGSAHLEVSQTDLSPTQGDWLSSSVGAGTGGNELAMQLPILRAFSQGKPVLPTSPLGTPLNFFEAHRETIEQTSEALSASTSPVSSDPRLPGPAIFLVQVGGTCVTGRAVCDALLAARRPTVAIHDGQDAKHFFTQLLSKNQRIRHAFPLRICLVGGGDAHINHVLQSYVELLGAKFPEQVMNSQFRFFVAPLPTTSSDDTNKGDKESWFIQRLITLDSTYAQLFSPAHNFSTLVTSSCSNIATTTRTLNVFLQRLYSYVEQANHIAHMSIGECLIVGKFRTTDNKEDEFAEKVVPFVGAVACGEAEHDLLPHIFAHSKSDTLTSGGQIEEFQRGKTPVSSPVASVHPPLFSPSDAPSNEVTLEYWQDTTSSSTTSTTPSSTVSQHSNAVLSPAVCENTSVSRSSGNTGGSSMERSKATSIKTSARSICVLPHVPDSTNSTVDSSGLLTMAWCSKERKQKLMRIGRKQQDLVRIDSLHRLTKVICSSKNQNNMMKISVDGMNYNHVKFFQVSPVWRTHVKYFPTALFSNKAATE